MMAKKLQILILISLISIFWKYSFSCANEYCATPPFITTSTKPNVLLVMDYSGSMQFPAYYECEFDRYYYFWDDTWGDFVGVANCGDKGDVDVSYNGSIIYYGYFKSDKCYSYNSSGYWEESSCNCSSNGNRGEIDCLRGNFLNFLIMSRVDVALKALIGGKAECNSSYCLLRPQGSKRYIDDEDLHCRYFIHPENYDSSSPAYPQKDILISILDYGNKKKCELGTFKNRYAKVKIPLEDREGIIQRNFSNLRLTFMVFGHYNHREGEIRYVFSQNNPSALLEALQNEIPYGGTPTGEALWEAWDFLAQSDNHYYESNTAYIDRTSQYDPFYYEGAPVPCIKNFIVLISDGDWNGDEDPDTPTRGLHVQDLRDDFSGNQTAIIYTLYTFSEDEYGLNSMRTIAVWGGFKDFEGCEDLRPYNLPNIFVDSRDVSFPRPNCDPLGTYNSTCCKEWDKNGDGEPDTFFKASSGKALENSLETIFRDILNKASAGTSVSAVTQEGRAGVALVQAVFYPEVPGTDLAWTGFLNTFWLYSTRIATNIREDSISNQILDVCNSTGEAGGDRILEFELSSSTGDLSIKAYNSACNGTPASNTSAHTYDRVDTVTGENSPVKIWEGGQKLSERSPSTRKIYTSANLENLLPAEPENLASGSNELIDLIDLNATSKYVLFGDEDEDGYVDESNETLREVIFSDNGLRVSDLIDYIYGTDKHGWRSRTFKAGNESRTWKLGDILYSTPLIVNYDHYAVVYVGANDGMLHAFRLGRKRFDGLQTKQFVRLCNDDLSATCQVDRLGEELWAFIPKNILPYLRYLTDPGYQSCHLYYIDLEPFLYAVDRDRDDHFERFILIGGMRLGGGVGCNKTGCIAPPKDTCDDPNNGSSCVGLSSYFALDVTDPENPKFLWEFTDPDLGFTYSGPAVVTYNGTPFVIFLNGPTSYNGSAELPLKAFILKLDSDKYTVVSQFSKDLSSPLGLSSTTKGFGGRLLTTGVDYNRDGNTDFLPFGVTYWDDSAVAWKGLIAGFIIKSDDPLAWPIKKYRENVGPVTAGVRGGKCKGAPWIYYATGRWFYKEDPSGPDNEIIGGIRLDPSSWDKASLIGSSWEEELNSAEIVNDTNYGKERSYTDPMLVPEGGAIFVTFEPTTDPCGFGGRTRVWAVECDNGSAINRDLGTIFLQLSRGNIQKVKLKEGLLKEEGKASNWFTGTPSSSPSLLVRPGEGIKGKILYWFEK